MSGTNPAPSPSPAPPQPPPQPQPPAAAAGGGARLSGGTIVAWLLGLALGLILVTYVVYAVNQRAGPIGRAADIAFGARPSVLRPPLEFRELIDASEQHLQIATIIGACHDVEVFSGAPPRIGQVMLLGLNMYGGYEHGRGDDLPARTAPLVLTNFQAALIRLSDATSRARVQSARAAAEQGDRMAAYQWAAVTIGAATTILVGLRSVANIPLPTALGALAIVFSALGTGCTTINSFFAPADAFSRADRALAQIRLLHRERSVALLMGPDACDGSPWAPDSPTDVRARFVRDWNTRLTEILTAAGASAQSTSGGGGTAPAAAPPRTGGGG